MTKYALAATAALLLAATQSAQAQILFSRPLRPPTSPAYGYGYPGLGFPGYGFGSAFSPFSYGVFPQAYPYGTPLTPGLLPGGVGRNLPNQPQQPGDFNLSPTRQAGAGLADVGSPNVTGHPTRFAAYAGYFNNQGGAISGTPSATAPYRTPPTSTVTGGVGSQPSSTPPSRSKSGMGGGSPTTPR